MAPATIIAAIKSMLVRELPIRSRTMPISVGLTKPARLPMELMIAAPAIAADPVKTAVGSEQNNGVHVRTPEAVTESAMTIPPYSAQTRLQQ